MSTKKEVHAYATSSNAPSSEQRPPVPALRTLHKPEHPSSYPSTTVMFLSEVVNSPSTASLYETNADKLSVDHSQVGPKPKKLRVSESKSLSISHLSNRARHQASMCKA